MSTNYTIILGTKEKHEHDILLWKAFINGKKWALSKIFSDFYDDLFLYGCHTLKNKELTRDLIQDLFLKIWKNRKNLNTTNNIRAYLLKGFRMLVIDFNKVNKIVPDQSEPNDDDLGFELSIENLIINNDDIEEQTKKMFTAFDQISPRQKEAIYLKYLKGYEYHEISSMMDVNIQSVRNLVHNGLNALKEKMQQKNQR